MLRCVPMTTAAKTIAKDRGWTYADYCRLPDDGKRHEIVDGRHYVGPAPEPYHQAIVLGLACEMRAKLQSTGHGQVFVAPLDVHLAPGTVVQPDVLVVDGRRRTIIGRTKITGVPTLVVEVLSPSSMARRRDRKVKRDRYQRAGVAEYLIVDPAARTIEQFVLTGGEYGPPCACTETVTLATFPGVVLDVRGLW